MNNQKKSKHENVEDQGEGELPVEAPTTDGPKASFVDYGLTGLGAGLVAGLGVALVDAIRLWLIGGLDWTLPGYAALLYGPLLGIIGAAAGVALAILYRVVKKPAAPRIVTGTLVGFLLFFVFVLAISYFYLFRDVFGEKLTLSSPPLLGSLMGVMVVLGGIGIGGALGLRKLVGGPLKKWENHLVPVGIYALGTGLLVVMWLAIGSPATGEPLAAAPKVERPNVILVMNDTHRADYSGPYGNKEGLTPRLDEMAKDAVVYKGYANSSWTRPSVSTILTGRYASSHTAMMKGSMLPDEITTLAEAMLAGGYETLGIATNYNLTPFFNVDQGFHYYRYLPPSLPLGSSDEQAKLIFVEIAKKVKAKLAGKREIPEDYYVVGEVVTDKALARLDERDKEHPFFMFLSYMDVHDPYFRHPFDGYGISHRANPNPDPNDTALIEEMKALYKGEIKYWDGHFGRLLDGLKERGLYDNTMIVVVSDHGEEFGEHGGFWHGTTLYDEQLEVLFIVKYAEGSLYASAGGSKVDSWHSLVDVAPMILDQAGLDIPAEMQGVVSHTGERDEVFAEEDHQGNILTSVRFESKDGRALKLIRANEGNPRGVETTELFDVTADPCEYDNIADSGAVTKEAVDALVAAQAKALEGAAQAATGELSGDMKSQLDALGYMEDEKAPEANPAKKVAKPKKKCWKTQ